MVSSRSRSARPRWAAWMLCLVLVVLVSACGAQDSSSERDSRSQPAFTAADSRTISGYGLSLTISQRWDGHITRPSPDDAIILQAASVPLPVDDEWGRKVQELMSEGDLYIKVADIGPPPADLVEVDPAWSYATPPLRIRRSDIYDVYQGVILPAYAARSLVVNDRSLLLYVGFGGPHVSESPKKGSDYVTDDMLKQANAILASLRVEQTTSRWSRSLEGFRRRQADAAVASDSTACRPRSIQVLRAPSDGLAAPCAQRESVSTS